MILEEFYEIKNLDFPIFFSVHFPKQMLKRVLEGSESAPKRNGDSSL